MKLVDRIRDPYSTVYAYIGEGLYQSGVGHTQGEIAAFEAAYRITQQADIVLPIVTAWLGAAYAQGGRPHDALVLLMEAERRGAYRFGGLYNAIHHYMALAQAHLAVGALPAAQTAIGRAQEIAEQAGGHLEDRLGQAVRADREPDQEWRRAGQAGGPRGHDGEGHVEAEHAQRVHAAGPEHDRQFVTLEGKAGLLWWGHARILPCLAVSGATAYDPAQ